MLEKILEIIYPKKCIFCNTINEDYTCKKCKIKLEYICANDKLERVEGKYFDYMISAYFYLDSIRNKILEFKFDNKKYLYRALSEELIRKMQIYISLFDCIISVPISIQRYMKRGYNQSELIAKSISQKLNKPLIRFCLIKVKNNKKQSGLKIEERFTNVKSVYKVINKNIISGKRILLIDDIYTTGATVNECSKVLKAAGANKVLVATIARAIKNK